jgi:hypothetical protein
MQNRLRAVTIIFIASVVVISFAVVSIPAQQRQTAPAPAAAGQTGYRAPRTADGKPNLNGIWQALNNANYDIEPHSAMAAPAALAQQIGTLSAIPPGVGIVEGGELPYKPEALAKKKENFEKRFTEDPEAKCYLPGVPRFVYMPYPFQILESPDFIMMVSEYKQALRTIYMTNQKPAPADSWMGWSNGHWEGETLVVDTQGFNDRSWFDRVGNYHSDALHVIERFTPIDADHLQYEANITDPEVFTRPWKISMLLYKHKEKNMQLLDYRCVEYSEDLIYGYLRKTPIK